MSQPLVSIIAVCLNHERFVLETLESIKNQTYRDFELLIFDNGSSDNSPIIIEKWIEENSASQINFYRCEKKEGLCGLLNKAISQAKGEYIQLISCDDVLAKEKIERHVDLFRALDSRYVVVFSEAYYINAKSESYYSRYLQSSFGKLFKVPEGNIYEYLLINGNFIPALTCLIKSCVFEDIGNYDENLKYEDFDMWLRIAKKYYFKFDSEETAYYRIHETNHNYKLDYRVEDFSIYIKHASEYPLVVREKLYETLMNMYKRQHELTLNYYTQFRFIFGSIALFRICYLLKIPFFLFSRLVKAFK